MIYRNMSLPKKKPFDLPPIRTAALHVSPDIGLYLAHFYVSDVRNKTKDHVKSFLLCWQDFGENQRATKKG